ncbi:hypothetical protein [Saccharopolyspora hattusasensis]|uniref:hypothetical protein n=1 Tax=Saccharopolyspora hattusasensis TaxID=1128679 RepID=UPI003D951F81
MLAAYWPSINGTSMNIGHTKVEVNCLPHARNNQLPSTASMPGNLSAPVVLGGVINSTDTQPELQR